MRPKCTFLFTLALAAGGCGDSGKPTRAGQFGDPLAAKAQSPFVMGSRIAPPLIPPGPGAGTWNSEAPSLENKALKKATLAFLSTGEARQRYGNDAVATLDHYFRGGGTDYALDARKMVAEVASVQERFEELIQSALQWCESIPEGETEFTMNEARLASVANEENENWYLAVAGYSYWIEGIARVTEIAGKRHAAIVGRLHIWDRYDWDPGVKVPIATPLGVVEIDQDRLGEFHRQGLAREFDSVGELDFAAQSSS